MLAEYSDMESKAFSKGIDISKRYNKLKELNIEIISTKHAIEFHHNKKNKRHSWFWDIIF